MVAGMKFTALHHQTEVRKFKHVMVRCPHCGCDGPRALFQYHAIQDHGILDAVVPEWPDSRGQYAELNVRGKGKPGPAKKWADDRARKRAQYQRNKDKRNAKRRKREAAKRAA
jgi:hypothetical protein